MKRIFFVEDDLSLMGGLSFALKKQGYDVEAARTFAQAEQMWQEGRYDLVILDVTLPDGSGFDLCREIRRHSQVPILFLTAADEETDVTLGLDIGGDDYVTKPFKLAIFLSRVNALLRRGGQFATKEEELSSHGVCVNRLKGEVYKGQEKIDLTAGEYKLLCLLMEHPDQILTPEQILGGLWDWEEHYIENKTLSVYIRRLRAKIEEDPSCPRRILTVRGMGYKWSGAK